MPSEKLDSEGGKSLKTIYLSYARVSSNGQKMDGVSIETQQSEHMLWADRHGINLAQENMYADGGYSAGKWKRPDLQRILRRISKNMKQNNGFEYEYIILIRDQSRMMRDLVKKRTLDDIFEKFNVKVICINGAPWDNDYSDYEQLHYEKERKGVPAKVIASYAQICRNGDYPFGMPPFGYKKVADGRRKKIVPDAYTKEIVIGIFNAIKNNEYSFKGLLRHLRKNKVADKSWNKRTLAKIINNPIYYGRFVQKWFDSEDINIKPIEKMNWYSETCWCESLISKEDFFEVQKIIHFKKPKTDHEYLFKDKVKCGICDEWMRIDCAWKYSTSTKRTLYQYYYCRSCRKRINEKVVLQSVLDKYPMFERESINPLLIEGLKKKIRKVKDRLAILNEQYDEDIIEVGEFKDQTGALQKDLKSLHKKLKLIQKTEVSDFEALTKTQKKYFAQKMIAFIKVHPGKMNEDADVTYIEYKLPQMLIPKRKKKVSG